MTSHGTNGCHQDSNQPMTRECAWGGRSLLFPQLTFSSRATCRGWCYPLSRVCLCGHVIWCKLERQTAKWVQRWCYGAVVAGNTANIPVMPRCCTRVTPIPRLVRDSVKLTSPYSDFQCHWVPVSKKRLRTAAMNGCRVCKGGVRGLCVWRFHQHHYHR